MVWNIRGSRAARQDPDWGMKIRMKSKSKIKSKSKSKIKSKSKVKNKSGQEGKWGRHKKPRAGARGCAEAAGV